MGGAGVAERGPSSGTSYTSPGSSSLSEKIALDLLMECSKWLQFEARAQQCKQLHPKNVCLTLATLTSLDIIKLV